MILRAIPFLPLLAFALMMSACASRDDGPEPPASEELSSMPHNLPQSWEGSAGMPGMGGAMGGGY